MALENVKHLRYGFIVDIWKCLRQFFRATCLHKIGMKWKSQNSRYQRGEAEVQLNGKILSAYTIKIARGWFSVEIFKRQVSNKTFLRIFVGLQVSFSCQSHVRLYDIHGKLYNVNAQKQQKLDERKLCC